VSGRGPLRGQVRHRCTARCGRGAARQRQQTSSPQHRFRSATFAGRAALEVGSWHFPYALNLRWPYDIYVTLSGVRRRDLGNVLLTFSLIQRYPSAKALIEELAA
jgi:hypothetical protein